MPKTISYARQIIFGLEDSLVSTLGVITGIAAGTGNPLIVVLSGFVVIFVESISMTAGEYLSSKSEKEILRGTLLERKQAIIDNPAEEKQKLKELYKKQGYQENELAAIIKRVTSDEELWLEEIGAHELRLGHQYISQPKRGAIYMGISYLFIGIVPLVAYFFLPIMHSIWVSVVLTAVTLFIIGAIKAKIAKITLWKSGFEMVVISLAAAAIGFGIGRLVSFIFGIDIA
ncbi:VIT1/CCC1 transporter family protein [Patescibacteria group bacterium]